MTHLVDTIFGTADYIVQLFETKEYKICRPLEVTLLDTILDVDDAGVFDIDSVQIVYEDDETCPRFELSDEIPELIDHLTPAQLPLPHSPNYILPPRVPEPVPARVPAPVPAQDSTAPAKKKRFATVESRLDVENLADERMAKLTKSNTKWAVKIFKGKLIFFVMKIF